MLTQTLGNVYENDGKRSREEICFYILMEAKKYIKKSTIVYQTNLNFKVLKKHLTLLKKRLRVENYEVSSSLKSRSEECGSTWSFN